MKKLVLAVVMVLGFSTAFATTLCPDGTWVGGTSCNLAPDSTWVGGGGTTLAPDGTWVGQY